MEITKELVEKKIRKLYAQGAEIEYITNLGANAYDMGAISVVNTDIGGLDSDYTVFVKHTDLRMKDADGKYLFDLLRKLNYDRQVEAREAEQKIVEIVDYLNS